MTYEEIVKKAQKTAKATDASKIKEHIAVQIDIVGEGEGAFYVEINDGKAVVEPYEYFDNDCKVTADADTILSIFDGKFNVAKALASGNVTVEGDSGKALVVVETIKKSTKKKTTTKKKAAVKKKASETKAKAKKKADNAKTTAKKKATETKIKAKKKTAEVKAKVEKKKSASKASSK